MAKGYPIGPPLQTKLAGESSTNHRHIDKHNCGEMAVLPKSGSPAAHDEFSGAARSYRLNQAP
jgi:hypothetical protein